MRARSLAWVRGMAAGVALLIALTVGAPPCSASEAGPGSTDKAPAKRSLASAAAARVALAPPARALAQTGAGGSATGTSRSFFRTPTGVAAIVLMVAGSGYAIYSVSHDQKPVKSPIR